jgi:hypothetical protein
MRLSRNCLRSAPIGISLLTVTLFWVFYFKFYPLENHAIYFGEVLYFSSFALIALLILKLIFFIRKEKILDLIVLLRTRIAVAILSAIVTTGLTFFWTPPDYRVLQDEATITSISYMMQKHHTATALYAARYEGNDFVSMAQMIDKRLPLFPLFTHFLGFLLGYSPANSFYANACTSTLFLSLIFYLTASLYGTWIGWIAQFLVISSPPYFLSATSAGFDLFSSAFLFTTLALSVCLLRKPTASIFGLWTLALGGLSYTRYESILPASVIVTVTFYFLPKFSRSFLKKEIPWIAPIAYFLSLWLALTLILLEPRFHEVPSGTPLFAWSHFVHNSCALFKGLFFPPENYPKLRLFYVLAVFSGAFVGASVWKSRSSLGMKAFSLSVLAIGTSLAISLFHFFGSYTTPTALRLFISPMIALALMPAIALGIAGKRWPFVAKYSPYFTIPAALLAYFATHSVTQAQIFADVGATRGYQISKKWIANLNPRTTLIVSDVPTNFAILEFGSIDFETFIENQSKILNSLGNGSLKQVLFFQNIARDSGRPQADEELPTSVAIQLLTETPESSRHLLRISELKR